MGAFHDWLTYQPLWQIALVLFLAMCAAAALGIPIRMLMSHTPDAKEREEAESFILSSVLGLLALLLGFTFSLAVDRYDTRRVLVLTEANAIGTAYLRSQLLEEPHRTRMSGILLRYTDNRIKLGQAQRNDPNAEALIAENDRLVTEIWQGADAAFPSIKGLDFSSTYLDTINEVIDLDATRKTARRARVPPVVFGVLFVYAIGSAGMLGYTQRIKNPVQVAVLLAMLTLVLMLIADIDRPTGGLVNEDQRPMIELRKSLAKDWQPQVFERFKTPEAPAPSSAPVK